ncbi:MAG TPA: hypothetical protein ENG90_12630 [Gammaproteobacteria bacterium]|mgnify:CR=1 FL=1|nr:hypothetical protein BMS3Abin11_00740 [bacterium BMS3Abin11]GMT39441.1 MAG: hypothetical protein IEMM0001_0176 [bacterium]HDH17295.1 hypothetical protein [Gammaproteobacteria bacterium]HDZ79478.1 hypothetical protein [Gammaproteobacteria bacterium]
MSTKQEKIQKMLDMQKKFIENEHANGFDAKDYYTPESGAVLDGYKDAYHEIAVGVMNDAHKERGSER